MHKKLISFLFVLGGFIAFLQPVQALDFYDLQKSNIVPRACNAAASCPEELKEVYKSIAVPDASGSATACAANYDDFKASPHTKHYWIEDPEITAQGQSNERARQFLDWTLNKSAIDSAPVITQIWRTTQSYALFFVLLVAAIFGIGIIVSKRTNFQLNIEVWPALTKIGVMVLSILFSAAIVISLIQLSEIIMLFFVENLGGRNLFNIYFSTNGGTLGGSETNYTEFIGCKDLNIRVQESISAELFLLKLTNITYYVMGVMVILRKVILWFMLFVSPFLPLLMPFVLIRNIGWIWIGVFFQWLFYGPLFAVFLGALNTIWKSGIPFQFDFSRAGKMAGYVYPTAINITYGGPAQIAGRSIGGVNNGNYIDTFVEYIITLIMLWAVTFFPWWLLRIFRDYCCDGIYAMKNILLAMYDQKRNGKPPKPKMPEPTLPSLKTNLSIQKDEDVKKTISISTLDQIRKTQTEDLSKTLSLRVSKLSDIAKLETNKQLNSVVTKNIAYLSNPVKAQSSIEKQQFMNLRTELFNRSVKQDQMARSMLQSTSSSQYERSRSQQELIKGIGNVVSSATAASSIATSQIIARVAESLNTTQQKAAQIVEQSSQQASRQLSKAITNLTTELHVSVDKLRDTMKFVHAEQQQKTENIMTAYMGKLTQNNRLLKTIAERTKLSQEDVRKIYHAYSQSASKPANQVINNISNVTNINQAKVQDVLLQTRGIFASREIITQLEQQKVSAVEVQQAVVRFGGNDTKTMGSENADQDTGPKAPPQKPTVEEAQVAKQVMQAVVEDEAKLEQVHQASGIATEQLEQEIGSFDPQGEPPTAVVRTVLKVINENLEATQNLDQEVAQQEQIQVEQAQKVLTEQLEITASPEKNIEKTVEVPESVSIEEYEEIKQMWIDQYAEGEIPVTENIQTREAWVEQDVVAISNIMNKVLSADEKMQQEGLEELGFIIPIFMINNLKGEQLVVYLKAKLEAAKAVRKDLAREKKLRAKFEKEALQKEDDEELVELKQKKTELKHMEMSYDEDQPNKERTIEDIGNASSDQGVPNQNFEENNDPLATIKNKLEEQGKDN